MSLFPQWLEALPRATEGGVDCLKNPASQIPRLLKISLRAANRPAPSRTADRSRFGRTPFTRSATPTGSSTPAVSDSAAPRPPPSGWAAASANASSAHSGRRRRSASYCRSTRTLARWCPAPWHTQWWRSRTGRDGVVTVHGEIDHAAKDMLSEALLSYDGAAPLRTVWTSAA